ncbi:MAG: type II toxin-antitoxin system VapC family toxin [Methanobrevibacter sp.]|nr:type II toxin-antitoxin system VapC family toxin [Methanobrevibacter sp.]
MSKLLFDTNFIVAYILELDESHERAIYLEDHKNIFDNERYITNHIIDEIVTIIGQKSNPHNALMVYRFLKDNFSILNEYEIFDFNDCVMNQYKNLNKPSKQKLGFTDCSIIEFARLSNMDAIVTFDKEFKNNGQIRIIS